MADHSWKMFLAKAIPIHLSANLRVLSHFFGCLPISSNYKNRLLKLFLMTKNYPEPRK